MSRSRMFRSSVGSSFEVRDGSGRVVATCEVVHRPGYNQPGLLVTVADGHAVAEPPPGPPIRVALVPSPSPGGSLVAGRDLRATFQDNRPGTERRP